LQRKPITVDWHDESHSFFVGTFDGGTIYRGRLDNPAAVVYLEGRRGQMAHGIDVVGNRMFIAGGLSGDIRVHDLASREQLGSFNTAPGDFSPTWS
jgi:hypothetical protein